MGFLTEKDLHINSLVLYSISIHTRNAFSYTFWLTSCVHSTKRITIEAARYPQFNAHSSAQLEASKNVVKYLD